LGLEQEGFEERSGDYGREAWRPPDPKRPAWTGWRRAGVRVVAGLARCFCIALRSSPGGPPRPDAIRIDSI